MQRGVGRGLAATKPAWMTSGNLGGLSGDADRDRGNSKRRRSPSRHDSRSRSRSTSRRRRGGNSGGGVGAGGTGRRSRSRSRSRARSPRSRSGGRKNRWLGPTNGARASGAFDQTKVVQGRAGGRGRGATLPAWMTQPDRAPGGLQEQNGDGGRRNERSPSLPKFASRSSVPLSQEPPYDRGGGGRGRGEGGRYGGGGGGGVGRGNGRAPEPLPPLFSVHKGEVVKTETFGAFVKLDGYRKHGLVHCSQMASYRVEDVTDVCKVGDTVFAKVIEVTDGAEPREQRISLSMKLVNQSTGEDLDASNAEAETDAQRRKPRTQGRAPVKLDAVFNTICTKCGGHGHLSIDCFSRGGKRYDLVDENEPRDAGMPNGSEMRGVRRESPHPGVLAGGRGRGATMPAWMTAMGLDKDDKAPKKKHKKEKKSKKHHKHRRHNESGSERGSGSDDDDAKSPSKKHKKYRKKHGHRHSGKHKHSKHSSKRHRDDKPEGNGASKDPSSGESEVENVHANANGNAIGDGNASQSRRDPSPRGRDRGGVRGRSGSRDSRRLASRGPSGGRGTGHERDGEVARDHSRHDDRRNGYSSQTRFPRRDRNLNRDGGGYRNGSGGRGREASPDVQNGGGRWKPRGDSDRSESRSTP